MHRNFSKPHILTKELVVLHTFFELQKAYLFHHILKSKLKNIIALYTKHQCITSDIKRHYIIEVYHIQLTGRFSLRASRVERMRSIHHMIPDVLSSD